MTLILITQLNSKIMRYRSHAHHSDDCELLRPIPSPDPQRCERTFQYPTRQSHSSASTYPSLRRRTHPTLQTPPVTETHSTKSRKDTSSLTLTRQPVVSVTQEACCCGYLPLVRHAPATKTRQCAPSSDPAQRLVTWWLHRCGCLVLGSRVWIGNWLGLLMVPAGIADGILIRRSVTSKIDIKTCLFDVPVIDSELVMLGQNILDTLQRQLRPLSQQKYACFQIHYYQHLQDLPA